MADQAVDSAKTVASVRRVVEKDAQITAAPFGGWVEIMVKAIDGGKNMLAEECDNKITKDNRWTRASREALWIGQERGFSVNEGKRCDMKMTIGLKKEESLPSKSKESWKWSFGKKVQVQGRELYKVERRARGEGYTNKEGQWVVWVKPGDPELRNTTIPQWAPICYLKNCKNCGF